MSVKKKILLLAFVILFLCSLVGCIPGDGTHTPDKPAGFFWGIWHGWVAPLSLIIGFFDRNIRIYEIHNSGWFYDLGFYIAVISGFGGISFVRKKKK
ncbi:MAG: hypothetical protein FWJ59_01910 [Caldicoprobacter sp.]|uniref:hypothetical protein n=1 Tax=Caldicoprobacter sp. TaxID=2004500 RepID=UPI001DF37978|nr:hypothetical protein [Clostridia bacterium]